MAHKQQFDFVNNIKKEYPHFFNNKKVLEVGSLNINGSVRDIFSNCDYTGIDVGAGPGVDIVIGGHEHDAPDNTYDVVISCECFEHNKEWVKTFRNMHRMCKERGMIIMTCATNGRPEHGTTRVNAHDSPLTVVNGWEYYKNLNQYDFYREFAMDDMFHGFYFDTAHRYGFLNDLYFFGMVWKP